MGTFFRKINLRLSFSPNFLLFFTRSIKWEEKEQIDDIMFSFVVILDFCFGSSSFLRLFRECL